VFDAADWARFAIVVEIAVDVEFASASVVTVKSTTRLPRLRELMISVAKAILRSFARSCRTLTKRAAFAVALFNRTAKELPEMRTVAPRSLPEVAAGVAAAVEEGGAVGADVELTRVPFVAVGVRDVVGAAEVVVMPIAAVVGLPTADVVGAVPVDVVERSVLSVVAATVVDTVDGVVVEGVEATDVVAAFGVVTEAVVVDALGEVGATEAPGATVVDAAVVTGLDAVVRPLDVVVGAAAEEVGAPAVHGATPIAKLFFTQAPAFAVGIGASERYGASGSAIDPTTHVSSCPVGGKG